MAELTTGKRSPLAGLLSLIIPGLGQIYLRKPMKGLILFLGTISAGGTIYINSLPVNSWRDLTHFNRSEKLQEEEQTETQMEENSGTSEPALGNDNPKKEHSYHLYTLKDKFLFHIGLAFQSDLDNESNISEDLWQVFQENRIRLSESATISSKKEDGQWSINNTYQTYFVKKEADWLNVYSVKKLMFRPSWKFKITGLLQGLIFWAYAIFDGWQGRREFNHRRTLKKK